MRKPHQKIKLDSRKEILEQYDYIADEEIFSKEPQYAKAIGSFLIAFSTVSAELDQLIAEAINDRSHDPGYRVVKYLNFSQKVNLARDQYGQLISFFSDPRLKRKNFREHGIIFSKLAEMGSFRNKVAHANWTTLDKSGYVRVKIDEGDGGIVFKKFKLTPQIILKFTRQCYAVARRISNFRDTVMEDFR